MFFGGFPFDAAGMGGGGMPRKEIDNETLYRNLGVEKTATQDEIKKSFKKLAIKHHPDKGGDQEKFKEICKAYEILSDPEKRRNYDEYGEEGVETGGTGPEGGIFEMFFGGGGRRRGPPRSDDVQSKIAFNLEDFFNGATKSMAINHDVICEECKGEGGPLDAIQKCEDCGGKGIQLLYERMGPMIRQSQAPCRACGTKGKRCAPGKQCKKCSGKGVVRERKVVEVHLPRGAPDGHRVTFTGDADQVPGQLPGDVIFNCVQRPHDVYTRRGDDLFMTKEITLKEALCGGGFYIRTLDQEEKFIQLNQTIKQDQVLAVENEGMSRNGSMFVRGNLFIRFDIKFPTLSDAEKKILEKALKGDLLKPRPDSEVLSLKYIDPKTQDRRGDDEDEYEQGPGNVQCKQA